jgi:hypothetical protein
MPEKPFQEIPVSDWRSVFELDEVKHGPSVFRGHCDSGWELRTSLDREFERLNIGNDYYVHNEHALLSAFRRRAHLYEHRIPKHEDSVSWLAMMQHHGAPTRLLDFTYSFYIACFFAFSGGRLDRPAVVWAISDLWLRTWLGGNKLREDYLADQADKANKFIATEHDRYKGGGKPQIAKNGIFILEPFCQLQRLAVQQGLFIMPKNMDDSFLNNVLTHPFESGEKMSDWHADTKQHIKKFVFSPEAKTVGLRELKEMNITAESLFPGMDGFARSLRHTVLAV